MVVYTCLYDEVHVIYLNVWMSDYALYLINTCHIFLTQRRGIFNLGVPGFSKTLQLHVYLKISEDVWNLIILN